MFRTLFVNIYEKACIEVKFVTVYARALVKLFDLADEDKKFKGLCTEMLKAVIRNHQYSEEDKELMDKWVYKHKDDTDGDIEDQVTFAIQQYARQYIVIQRLKYEIDNGVPYNKQYEEQEGDSEQEKVVKAPFRQIHIKHAMQFISQFLVADKDKGRVLITLPEYASFLNYMISNMSKMMRQLAKERKIRIDKQFDKDFDKEWSAK